MSDTPKSKSYLGRGCLAAAAVAIITIVVVDLY